MSNAVGRPRDPSVDARIHEAALDLYGQIGWAGFTIDAVAQRARVSKASIYLRWDSKEELLSESVASTYSAIATIDTGSIEGDLARLIEILLELFSGRHGLAARRMSLEAHATRSVGERWEAVRLSHITASKDLATRAIQRGELPATTPVDVLLDAVCGAAINHANAVPLHLKDRAAQRQAEFVATLVRLTLAGARAS